ncbi:hypothetical protein [Streptomyces sp. NPDC050263]|uniref:hypothetical protein n=1 Tax=Streptomyces sp. NPDC050263 TaxID=3155037 RepID=UPI003424429D
MNMPLMDDEREALIMGVVIAGGGSVFLLVCGLIWGFPWQAILLVAAVTVVLGVTLSAMTLAEVRRDAERKSRSRGLLTAWAGRNGGRCETDLDAFTADGEEWKLPASPLFRGELLAVVHRDGVEVGIACSTVDEGLEGGNSWYTAILVRLSEKRPPARLHRRDAGRLDLPQDVKSVETGRQELCVWYVGWPDASHVLDTRVDAAVRLAASLPET